MEIAFASGVARGRSCRSAAADVRVGRRGRFACGSRRGRWSSLSTVVSLAAGGRPSDNDDDLTGDNAEASSEPPESPFQKPKRQKLRFPPAAAGRRALQEVATQMDGGEEALRRRLGIASAQVMHETFPASMNPMVLLMCGAGATGHVGLFCARRLQELGYTVTVLQLEKNRFFDEEDVHETGLSFIEFLPGPFGAIYDMLVDAMLGGGYDDEPLRAPYVQVIEAIANAENPTVSIDMPTGWALDHGPKDKDLWAGFALKPDVLISLGVPSAGSARFGGAFHYIAGNIFSEEAFRDLNVLLPSFAKDCDFTLVSSNPTLFGWGKNPGEVYGNYGAYQGTLFPKPQTRRKWVDIDADDALWDEVD